MNFLSLILIVIIGALLFIIFKMATNTNIPNIDTKFDFSRRNSPNIKIKDDHRVNINIDESTHYHEKTTTYYDPPITRPNHSSNDPLEIAIVLFVCAFLVFIIYKRYITYINYFFILTPLIAVIICLGLGLYYKSKAELTTELVAFLLISIFSISIVAISSLFPLYEPEHLKSLLTAASSPNLANDWESIVFVVLKLAGYGLNIFINFVFFFEIIKNKKYQNINFKIKSVYPTLILITIICFVFSSGLFSMFIEFYKNRAI